MLDVYEVAADHTGLDLHISDIGAHGGYGDDGTAVNIAERIEVYQVVQGVDTQLPFKERGPPWPHAGKELYVIF